jgi:hypothetical protein
MLLSSAGDRGDAHRQNAAFRREQQRAADGAAPDDSDSFHEILHNAPDWDLNANAVLNLNCVSLIQADMNKRAPAAAKEIGLF